MKISHELPQMQVKQKVMHIYMDTYTHTHIFTYVHIYV